MAMQPRKTVGAIAGAAFIAASTVIGINVSTKPNPIPVTASLCEKGKTAVPVKYQDKSYAKGTPCTPIVKVPRKKN